MQYRNINEIHRLEANPRYITESDFKILCESIKKNKKYFEARPIILSNRTGKLVVIAGNQRLMAAKELELKEVPTYLIEGLTVEQEKEIIIRDNINNGQFDYDELANNWDEKELKEWGLKVWQAPTEEPQWSEEKQEQFKILLDFENEEKREQAYNYLVEKGYNPKKK